MKNGIFILCVLLLFSGCRKETVHCQLADKAMFSYAKKLQKEEGLFMDGWGGEMMYDIQKFGMSYVSEKKLNVEESRILYVKILEGFRQKINSDEKIRPYLRNYPFDEKNFNLHLSFEDENDHFISNDFVAFISIIGDKVYYRSYDHKKDVFVLIHQEPYSEALRIVQESHALDNALPQLKQIPEPL